MGKVKKSVKEAQEITRGVDEKIEECNEAYTKGAFKYLRLVIHLISVLQFIYAIYYMLKYVHEPKSNISKPVNVDFGGKFKFLTFLNLILQAVYHSIALLNDLFGSNFVSTNSKTPFLRSLRDFIFAAFAFPIASNVCLSFWGVYAVDRELVFPRHLDAIFPNWLNHVVHTNVAMLIILDMFTCFRSFPKRRIGFTSIALVMFIYLGWLHVARFYAGRWAYPLFDVLDTPMRYFMLFGMVIVSIACYLVGEFINNIVWAPELKLLLQKEKLKGK